MKIALPVNENSMTSKIASSFGRASYFLIYDLDKKEGTFIDNAAVASQGGAGIKAAQTIVDSGAKALLVPQCGENAAKVIEKAGIKLYKNQGDDIANNIEAFAEDKLSTLDAIHPGYHGHGGQ